MITIYGIPNCDTMRKARAWLEACGVAHDFHDYKNAGVARTKLERWCGEHGWETALNRAGPTFRKLDPAITKDLDARKAVALMVAHASAIKRPVHDLGPRTLVGFKPEVYEAAFARKR